MGIGQWLSSSALLEQKVRETLESSGLPFSEQVPLDGYQADFVFQTPDGHRHIVEAKAWESTRPELTRAKKLAANLKTLPVEGSYVVLPSLESRAAFAGPRA